jgi:hypothetical protein
MGLGETLLHDDPQQEREPLRFGSGRTANTTGWTLLY